MTTRLIRVAEEDSEAFFPDGVFGLTNTSGIGAKVIDGGDAVLYAFQNDEGYETPQEATVEYGIRGENNEVEDFSDENQDKDTEPYFKTENGEVYWLGDFMRTNY